MSAVDKTTAQSIEAATKIEEDPEAEAVEPPRNGKPTDASTPAASHRASSISAADDETVKSIESASKIDEEPQAEAAAVEPETKMASTAAAKKDGEQHVKFEGERPGKEIDRVKATLATGTGTKLDGSARNASTERPTSRAAASKDTATAIEPTSKDEVDEGVTKVGGKEGLTVKSEGNNADAMDS